jgi:maltose alpha-D-glucosyltransferase / alpha-amylase
MKRLIDLRKRHPAFGRGSLEFLHPENRRILAFIREHEGRRILVVANLSRFVQHADLDLAAYEGYVPVEMFGRVEFPVVTAAPWFLSIGPHGFLWFELEPPDAATGGPSGPEELPILLPVDTITDLVRGPAAAALSSVLSTWIRSRRWFRGKARRIKGGSISDAVVVPFGERRALVTLFEVDYTEGDPETYLVPLTLLEPLTAAVLLADQPNAGVARLRSPGADADAAYLVDAALVPDFSAALLGAIADRRRFRGARGELVARPERAFRGLRGDRAVALAPTPVRSEQSNSSVIFGERVILKLYRAIEPGTNPDLEIGRFLSEGGLESIPALAGSIDYRAPDGSTATAAILQEFVPNAGDVFVYTLDALRDFLERAAAEAGDPGVDGISVAALLEASRMEPPEFARDMIDAYLDTARLLGVRTGEMHVALAADPGNPAFAPEPFSELYQRSVYQSILTTTRESVRLLAGRLPTLDPAFRGEAERVLALEPEVHELLRGLLTRKLGGMRIRTHGDFHLGQVLHTGRDLAIIDFEGEPARPLSERRLKRSPLRDVAGMLRSFHYAGFGSLLRMELGASLRREDALPLEPWVRFWYQWVSASYLGGYREATQSARFLPPDDAEWEVLLNAFLLHKAYYEVGYELNNRPDWVEIPLRGILELLGR